MRPLADVREVIKAILGDYLNLNYSIDPSVQGQVSIQTSKPLARDALLSALEQSLRQNGLGITRANDLFRVGPIAEVSRQGGLQPANRQPGGQPGFGTTIAQLRYVGVNEMRRMIEPIFPAGSIVHADQTRNFLVLSGTEQERAMMLENVALFDVDWLSGMSFALFTPKNVDVKVLTQELEGVVGGKESPLAGLVRFVPIQRLNAVLVISPQPEYLEELKAWVERLDRTGDGADMRIYVYPVQNGRATDIAAVLTRVLGASKPNRTAGASPGDGDGRPAAISAAPFDAGDGTGGGISIRGMGDISITSDEINNALVVLATPRDWRVIETALRQLDTAPLQVLLEAVVAEVTLTDELRYGVQYYMKRGHNEVLRTASASKSIAATLPGFAYTFKTNNIQVILDALSDVTTVNVVSSPQVMVLNNQSASLQVGDEVPIATQQSVNTTAAGAPVINSIQYKNTGVILKVTPRVNQGGVVMMDIAQEVSDVTNTVSSSLDSPTIQQRKLSTTIAGRDGETIALGGLIKDSRTRENSGIPLLKDIPFLGALFGSTSNSATRTELLVLMTPHVVDNLERARAVTDELKTKVPAALVPLRQLVPVQKK